MQVPSNLKQVIPVLPSANIERDIAWYQEKLGLKTYFSEHGYAVLYRENICIHLQWHADTESDPLLGGSVIRIGVHDIDMIFEEMIASGAVTRDKMQRNTPWGTHEFGFLDLNKNAIYFMQDIDGK